MSEQPRVESRGATVRFAVRVQPRGGRDAIVGVHGGALKVRLAAPPVDGAANDALVAFLAAAFAVRRTDVTLVAGRTSRTKTIEIAGVSAADVYRLAQDPGTSTR